MKKRMHFERRSKDAIHGRKGYYASITVVMKFKKPVNIHDLRPLTPYIDKALADLAKDYPDDIIIDGWFFSPNRLGLLYVTLSVSRDFVRENLGYGDWWAPEKYLGYYLSRIARRIRKSDPSFAKRFKDGMFKHHYIYT